MEIRKRLRAFTLVELLIVITIIGILAVALVPRITGAPGKARDAQRKGDLQQIATGLELYADDNGGIYPATGTGCVAALSISSYLTSIPEDPQGTNNPSVGCADGYEYYKTTTGYILSAALESTTASGDGLYEGAALTGGDTDPTATVIGRLSACASAACTSGTTTTYYLQR